MTLSGKAAKISPKDRCVCLFTSANSSGDCVCDSLRCGGFIQYELAGRESLIQTSSNTQNIVIEKDAAASIEVNTRSNGGGLNASDLEPEVSQLDSTPCSTILLPNLNKAILLRTLANDANILQDAYHSCYRLVLQAYADLEVRGARQLALSDCVNSGDPEDPQTAHQIVEGIRGRIQSSTQGRGKSERGVQRICLPQ